MRRTREGITEIRVVGDESHIDILEARVECRGASLDEGQSQEEQSEPGCQAVDEQALLDEGQWPIRPRLRPCDVFGEAGDLDLDSVLEPSDYVGRAPQQVDTFVEQVVEPIRARYGQALSDVQQVRV